MFFWRNKPTYLPTLNPPPPPVPPCLFYKYLEVKLQILKVLSQY